MGAEASAAPSNKCSSSPDEPQKMQMASIAELRQSNISRWAMKEEVINSFGFLGESLKWLDCVSSPGVMFPQMAEMQDQGIIPAVKYEVLTDLVDKESGMIVLGYGGCLSDDLVEEPGSDHEADASDRPPSGSLRDLAQTMKPMRQTA